MVAARQATTETRTFEHRSVIPTTLECIWAFHDGDNILGVLTPPPIFVRVLRDDRTSLTAGEIEFQLWFGPLPVHWVARHEPGPTPTSFVDRMVDGPLDVWVHEHCMTAVPGGVELKDTITIADRRRGFWSVFTRLAFGPVPLRLLFTYRHWRTRRALR